MVKVDEKKLRGLTALVAKSILKAGEDYHYEIESLLPIVEKFAPENLAALRQRKRRWKTPASGANTRLTKSLWKAIPRRKNSYRKPRNFLNLSVINILRGG
jgi:hypothetical protein